MEFPRLAGVFRYAQTQHLVVFMAGGWIDAVVHSHLGMFLFDDIVSPVERKPNCNGVEELLSEGVELDSKDAKHGNCMKLYEIVSYSMVTFSEIWCHGIAFLCFCHGSSLEMHIIHSWEHTWSNMFTLVSFSHSLQIG